MDSTIDILFYPLLNERNIMDNVNSCTVSGRLIKVPEMRTTPTKVKVCDLYIASNKYKKVKGIKTQFTTIIPITLWNKSAEFWGQKLNISDHIFITGELADDNFTSYDEEGNIKYTTTGRLKIDSARITLLSPANKENIEMEDKPSIPIV